ncbi:MAG: DUF1559 domain-containing protein [Pirellulaceae bacterium]|nr:DUF1559 domain-containing protein [Pirellulaceae bacterium]
MDSQKSNQSGFTLVELLVVIAIIGALIALLLPAVQAAREAGRRVQCSNHLRQMGLALHSYHDTFASFPSGITYPSRAFWSAHLLPYLERKPLYDTLDFSAGWEVAGTPNANACATFLSIYQCPSSGSPASTEIQGIAGRVPCNYLAVASGTDTLDAGDPAHHLGAAKRNGLMYVSSRTNLRDVRDGSSQTLAIGEALFLPDKFGPDATGAEQIVDHWYIGSDGIGYSTTPGSGLMEASEALGSTGVQINCYDLPVTIDHKEIGFSSRHSGGAQFVFTDGHVKFMSANISAATYSALGTIAAGELVAE